MASLFELTMRLEPNAWHENARYFFKYFMETLYNNEVDLIAIEKESNAVTKGRLSINQLENLPGKKIPNQKTMDILYGKVQKG